MSAVLFFLLHWPCSTTLWTIRRETGSTKWTLLAALLPTAMGMALCTALIGSVLIFTGAYLMEKTKGQKHLNLALRMLSFVPMAVPGLVLGLGYVFFFNLNGNPLHVLYGTMTLLVVCTIAHYLTTAQMTATTTPSSKPPRCRSRRRCTATICGSPCRSACRRCWTSCATCLSRR